MIDDSEEAELAAKLAQAAYDAVCADGPSVSWSTTEQSGADAIARLGPLADLVIMERLSEEEGPPAAGLNAALFDGAGPVLITPHEPPPTIATNPVIVWNAGRQSTLAVKSAMPFLALAGKATVLSGNDVVPDNFGELEKYLDAYGVTMTVERFSTDKLTARG